MSSPISSVQPCNVNGITTGDAVTTLPVPSKYVYNLHDISASDAGRLESMRMIKMRQGQARSIDLEWVYPTVEDASTILKAFNSEYLKITFIDAMEGTELTKVFYVGDRISPLWNHARGRWGSIGFTIIQQTAE